MVAPDRIVRFINFFLIIECSDYHLACHVHSWYQITSGGAVAAFGGALL